ncbi:arsenic resistance protein [Agromyces silvae]|uniref:arsenic resistance protein n=1 Tax=Agromyces silvae TaxID=3388266 RepID=UPI00280B1663|nr:arsenic resistance protein [Agromyces protaetiae]
MQRAIEWWEGRQVWLYLAAIAAGAIVGLSAPTLAHPLEVAITPVLGVLLYATFLAVPITHLGRAFRDGRFLVAILALNFVLIPLVVFALSRFVAGDPALLVGVLLVLLTPCVDYVIVFTGLAGGARDRLIATTPVLMLAQILLLPVYLWLMAGPDVIATFDAAPFVEAFVWLIAVPLAAAAATQALARRIRPARTLRSGFLGAMVPLMMLTLAIVVASQIAAVSGQLAALVTVLPLFAAFPLLVGPLGALVARTARLGVPERRAVVFSGVTRNSLVVLPLALALPAGFTLTPLVVVTQTLVELVVMVLMVALVPRAITGPRTREEAAP